MNAVRSLFNAFLARRYRGKAPKAKINDFITRRVDGKGRIAYRGKTKNRIGLRWTAK